MQADLRGWIKTLLSIPSVNGECDRHRNRGGSDLGQLARDVGQSWRAVDRKYNASVVDINLGCPVKKETGKAQSGSYLLSQPEKMGTIIEQVVQACSPTPVMPKICLSCTSDQINAIVLAQVIQGGPGATVPKTSFGVESLSQGHVNRNSLRSIEALARLKHQLN